MKSAILALFSLCSAVAKLPYVDQLYDPIVDVFAQPHYTVGYTDDIPTLARIILHYGGLSQYDSMNVIHNGQKLVCLLPPERPTQFETVSEMSQEAVEKATEAFNKFALNASEPLYQIGTYWAYVLNATGKVIQTHPIYENNKMILNYAPQHTYELGNYNASNGSLAKLQTRWALTVDYDNGQYCKLVSANRETKVYYVCDPRAQEAKMLLQAEQRTCSYEITVALPDLCKIPEFRPVFIPQNPTICTHPEIYETLHAANTIEPGVNLDFELAPINDVYLQHLFTEDVGDEAQKKKNSEFRVGLVDQFMD